MNYKPKIMLECMGCGKKFQVRPCLGDQKYCSRACYVATRHGSINNEPSKNKDYLLGVIHGDGHCRQHPSDIAISVGHDDRDYGELLQNIIEEEFDRRWNILNGRNADNVKMYGAAADYFLHVKKKGKWMSGPRVSIADYLAGIFDTDGSFVPKYDRSGGRITFSQKYRVNTLKVNEYLNLLGIMTTGVKGYRYFHSSLKKHFKVYVVSIANQCQIRKFAQIIGSRHPRKKLMLEQILESYGDTEKRANNSLGRWLASNFQNRPFTSMDLCAKYGGTTGSIHWQLTRLKSLGLLKSTKLKNLAGYRTNIWEVISTPKWKNFRA